MRDIPTIEPMPTIRMYTNPVSLFENRVDTRRTIAELPASPWALPIKNDFFVAVSVEVAEVVFFSVATFLFIE